MVNLNDTHSQYTKPLDELDAAISECISEIKEKMKNEIDNQEEINQLIVLASQLSSEMSIKLSLPDVIHSDLELIDIEVDRQIILVTKQARTFPKLNTLDYIVASLSGLLSVMIDVVFVGSP